MEFLILLCAAFTCILTLMLKTESKPAYLLLLSGNIIVSFIILMTQASTPIGIFMFIANLMISPWVTFYKLQGNVPLKRDKDPQKKNLREFLSGE